MTDGEPNALTPEAAMAADPEREDARPRTVVLDARDLAVELFGKPWRQIELGDVQSFLDGTHDHEPLHWEVKGTELPRPDSLRKTLAGLANREGGFLILGGEHDADSRVWRLTGVPFANDEPARWLAQLLRDGIRPAPEIDPRVLWHEPPMAVAVILVQPINRAPAMVRGRIPERHAGGTVWIEDGAAAVTVVERVVSRSRGQPLAESESEPTASDGSGPKPAPALSADLDADTFVATLRDDLTEGREAEIEVFLAGALARVRGCVDGGDHAALARELDRATDCAALALTFSPGSELVTRSVDVLKGSFDLGFGGAGGGEVSREQLWLAVLTPVRALGGLAIRLGRWGAIRELVLHEVHDGSRRLWPTWLRYGDIHVSRAGLYREGQPGLLEGSRRPLRLAADHMIRQSSLHPDGVVDESELITALCQFDLLVNAVGAWEASKSSPQEAVFPYYAAWEADRVRPIADRIVSDRRLRDAVLPGVDDSDLAVLLRFVGARAARLSESLGSWLFWDGFEEGRTAAFIAQHHP